MPSTDGEITTLLRQARSGDPDVLSQLAELIYSELRRLASAKLRSERPGHTLSPTALVNEAWLRISSDLADRDLKNREHFFAVAATAMRRILVDHARARRANKRAGQVNAVDLESVDVAAPEADDVMIGVDEALNRLAAVKPRVSRVTELRFFVGLSHQQIADIMGIERRTVDRDWAMARAWLAGELGQPGGAGAG